MDEKAVVLDKNIYEKAKTIVYAQYRKASAYRSGALFRKYKELGGRYSNEINKKTIINKMVQRKMDRC